MGNDGESPAVEIFDGEKLDEISAEPRSVEEKLAKYIHPSIRFTSRWQAPYIVEWLQGLGVEPVCYRQDNNISPHFVPEDVIFVPGYKLRLGGTIVVYGPQDVIVYE